MRGGRGAAAAFLAAALVVGLSPAEAIWRGADEREAIDGCTCHYFEASPAVNVSLRGLPALYLDGATYDLRVEVFSNVTRTASPLHLAGFQLQASAGEFLIAYDQVDVRLGAVPPGSTSYTNPLVATHSTLGTNQTRWNVLWRAPDPGAPWNVTFWLAAMGVNGDGVGFWPDEWQKKVFHLGPVAPSVTLSDPPEGAAVEGYLTLFGNATPAGKAKVRVDLDGQNVGEVTNASAWSFLLDTTRRVDGRHNLTLTPSVGMRTGEPLVRDVIFSNAPPAVPIESPTEGAVVEGEFAVFGSADDASVGEEVARVVVALGDPALGALWQEAEGTANWTAFLYSNVVGDGFAPVVARASNGLAWGPPVSVTVRVRNGNAAPVVSVAGLPNDTLVRDTVEVHGTAADDRGVARVEFSMDGGPWVSANGTDVWSFVVDARGHGPGNSTLLIRAFDGVSYSTALPITLRLLPNRAPTLELTEPAAGTLFTSELRVEGTGEDDSPAWWVLVSVDGALWENLSGRSAWNVTIAPAGLAPGVHTLSVRASDGEFTTAPLNRSLIIPSVAPPPPSPSLAPMLASVAAVAVASLALGALVWLRRARVRSR